MIDIKKILHDKDSIQEVLRKRDPHISLDEIINVDAARRSLQSEYDTTRAKIKELSKQVGREGKSSPNYEAVKEESKTLGDSLQGISSRLDAANEKLSGLMLELPNIILPDVPVSQNKEDKVITHHYSSVPEFSFDLKDHVTLGESLGILDFTRATKMAEPGFPLYRGKGAQLEFALISFMLDKAISKGFELFMPPLLNNTESLVTTGNLPKFKEEIYSCQRDDLHLIPTAETPLTNLYRGEILEGNELPIRLAAYTPCFRREAGAAGKLTRGLMRLHQFNKVETYSICTPEMAKKEHALLIENGEEILKDLGLHFRLANLPSCDLAHQSAQTFDIEIWLPVLQQYSEVSSASNCLDYQARRAKIKYKKDGKSEFAYTLNCSALATPRIMIAMMETNQTPDGHIIVPDALRPYTKFDII